VHLNKKTRDIGDITDKDVQDGWNMLLGPLICTKSNFPQPLYVFPPFKWNKPNIKTTFFCSASGDMWLLMRRIDCQRDHKSHGRNLAVWTVNQALLL